MPLTLILIYCAFIFMASMLGGNLPSFVKLTHTRLQLAMSLIGGLMLGVALLHLLPHSVVATESLDATMMAAVAGLLTMFFLIRIFHVHPHSPHDETPVPCHHAIPATTSLVDTALAESEYYSDPQGASPHRAPRSAANEHHPDHDHDHNHGAGHGPGQVHGHSPGHDHAHEHHHDHDHAHDHADNHAVAPVSGRSTESGHLSEGNSTAGNPDHSGQLGGRLGRAGGGRHFSWFGLAIGLSIHTMIDGMALAASVALEASHGSVGLWGLPAFLAIAFHKPLDAMSIATVMSAGGWSLRSTRIVTALFSLMCPLGALAFLLGIERLFDEHYMVLGVALGFSAGVFLCIALADLLPEVQFHSHDRIKLSAALLAGVLLAYLITFIEPEHAHSHGSGHRHGPDGSHGHHGHDHGHDHDH